MKKERSIFSRYNITNNEDLRLAAQQQAVELKDEHRTSNSPQASKHLSASGGSNVESQPVIVYKIT